MGITHAKLTITNPLLRQLEPIEAEALADTGAMHLCIPEHVAIQLELVEKEKREVTLADSSKRLYPYVGPVELRFGNRSCYVGAMVMGDEVLLGAIPMEDMDLIVRPLSREVLINPASPNIPSSLAKGFRGK
ncbi:MAG: clan AA aspartic protease [Candidatus Nitricoxidivorans perseverans]|uniref:Clan AA aspartic protease n=1 Tax=Candidatus Nitricoxidivorans perseverans TaxID=2975601 RepID=A0AA49FNM1_9PROT|nr:MAG: clan AA aspartic protease [Candidatus Nitricoxidivorans perseverans]